MAEAAEIEITPEMVAAGECAFEAWFDLQENAEAMVSMPDQALIRALLSDSFSAMISCKPASA
jgi:hypothetical protein